MNTTPTHDTAQALLDAWLAHEPVLSLEMAPDTFPMIEQQIQHAAFEYLGRMLGPAQGEMPEKPCEALDRIVAAIIASVTITNVLTPLAVQHATWLAVNWYYGNGSAALIQKAIDRGEGERILSVRRPMFTGGPMVEITKMPIAGPPTSFTLEAALQVIDQAIGMEYPPHLPRHKIGVLVPILVLEQLRDAVERRRPTLVPPPEETPPA